MAADVTEHELRAGPDTFGFSIPVLDFKEPLVLVRARVRGTLEVTEELGLSLTERTSWGALRLTDLEQALDSVQAA